jgi:AcrR family transcriptional regulator
MNKTHEKIAAGLEQAFAKNGFTELGVDGLRDAAQVSLRTLYKYCPSKEAMIIMALEYRHARYLNHLFTDLSAKRDEVPFEIFYRVGQWMHENSSEGCLFHNAVVSYPNSEPIRSMLERHKKEVAERMTEAAGIPTIKAQLLLLHEGIVQSWPVLGEQAATSANMLLVAMLENQKYSIAK